MHNSIHLQILAIRNISLCLVVTFLFSKSSFAQLKPKITLVYFNQVNKQLKQKIKVGVESTYNCVIIPYRNISLPPASFYPLRNLYRAEKILDYLKTISDNKDTIGITT